MDTPNGYTDAPQKEGVMSARQEKKMMHQAAPAHLQCWEGMADGRPHDCARLDGHGGEHWCAECGCTWVTPAR